MNKNIKMVGLDLDGTLLDSNKKVSEHTKNVLEEAIRQGCVVLVSTGRPLPAVPREVLNIKGMKYAVAVNGTKIVNLETGELLLEYLFSAESAIKALQVCAEYDCILELLMDEKIYATAECMERLEDYYDRPGMIEYVRSSRTPAEDVIGMLQQNMKPVDKIRAVFRHTEDREEAMRRLKEMDEGIVTSSSKIDLEVNAKGINKGLGLVWLGKKLGIKREEIMACGDHLNDYEMLKEVGFAVAMGNAMEELKEIADYVTDTNDEDGVAKAIERFVLRSEGAI